MGLASRDKWATTMKILATILTRIPKSSSLLSTKYTTHLPSSSPCSTLQPRLPSCTTPGGSFPTFPGPRSRPSLGTCLGTAPRTILTFLIGPLPLGYGETSSRVIPSNAEQERNSSAKYCVTVEGRIHGL